MGPPNFSIPDFSIPDFSSTYPEIDPEVFEDMYEETLPYGALSSISTEKLVNRYNDHAEDGSPVAMQKAQLILSELQRRDAASRERRMVEATVQVKGLTWAIFALTLINVLLIASQTLGQS